MARQKKKTEKAGENVVDYRHKNVKRLNIPPAGLTARGHIVREKKVRYAYNPHLSPVLRFDATGKTDSIEKLIDDTSHRKLEPHEINLLQEVLRNHEPWLEWAGKREQQWCVADPVALHIHERISTQAILRVAKRQDVQRDLFADPEQEYREAVQFYKHPMDWTNRMILGDSLRGHGIIGPPRGTGRQGPDDLHGPAVRHQVCKQLPARSRPPPTKANRSDSGRQKNHL